MMVQDARRFLGGPVRVDLYQLVGQVVGQVYGGNERAALERFLELAQPGEQEVVVNLADIEIVDRSVNQPQFPVATDDFFETVGFSPDTSPSEADFLTK